MSLVFVEVFYAVIKIVDRLCMCFLSQYEVVKEYLIAYHWIQTNDYYIQIKSAIKNDRNEILKI